MIKKSGLYDINKLPTDGYIMFPISMSRITNAQNAEECYKAIEFLEKKMSAVGVDGIFCIQMDFTITMMNPHSLLEKD